MDNTRSSTFLYSLEDYSREELTRLLLASGSIPPQDCARLGARLGRQLRDFIALTWGGQQIYIRQPAEQLAARIYNEFSGDNFLALAQRYGITERQVRNIIQQEQESRRLCQHSLMDFLKRNDHE